MVVRGGREGFRLGRLRYLEAPNLRLIFQLQTYYFDGLSLFWSLRLLWLGAREGEGRGARYQLVREKYLLEIAHPVAVHQVDLTGVGSKLVICVAGRTTAC